MTEGESETQATLQFVSMKESFDLELLTRFYNEIMIPNFPGRPAKLRWRTQTWSRLDTPPL